MARVRADRKVCRVIDDDGDVFSKDPLDGTSDFVKGIRECVTTLIGLAWKGKPLAGIVYYPFSQRCLFGIVKVGTFVESSTADKSPLAQISAPLHGIEAGRRCIVTTSSHRNA